MELPFTIQQFLAVFAAYNRAIWPAPVVAYALGLAAVVLAIRRPPVSGRTISTILAIFWLWMGAVYHILFFSEINPAAYLFGGLFLVQGLLFLIAGGLLGNLDFQIRADLSGIAGGVLVLYAMVIYPALGTFLGHGYPAAPVFGVAPCPTTIFTFGLLLWTRGRAPGWLFIIPALWSAIGFLAALQLGILEDIGLLVAAVVAGTMLLVRNHLLLVPTDPPA